MKTNPYFFRTALIFAAILHLAGCSGDNAQIAGGPGGTGGTGMSHGVMTKGSVIVNGVRFEDTAANILIDDTPKTAINLKDGMVISVSGSVDDSGRNGTATEVRGQIEVRGLVTAKNAAISPQRFTVFGQIVIVDDLTVYSNITFAGITANTTIVEVHGQRDATGNIRATRVEGSLTALGDGTGMANPLVDEIRGVVSGGAAGSNPTTFNLGTQAVALTAGATIVGGSFANGSIVEVHCTARPSCLATGVFQASRVEVEDNVNRPGVGQRFEAEGLVSDFTAHPGSFNINDVRVTTTATTTFRGGIATDLMNNIKVEAEGTWNGTTLTARKIEFKRAVVRLQGVVTGSATNTFTLRIGDAAAARTITVETDSFTQGAVPPVNLTDCIQVRGQRKAGGGLTITAGEISTNCSSSDDHLIQAPVEAESGTNLTLLGFAIGVGSPTDNPPYQGLDDTALTQTQFLAAVTPADVGPPATAGTLVKIRFNAGATTVKQVELED
ncbi:MAG: DUF5666 domain-containing protein [Candidatus Nitrotoga sp.]